MHIVNFREILLTLNLACSLKDIDIFGNTISSSDDQINAKQFTKKNEQKFNKTYIVQ